MKQKIACLSLNRSKISSIIYPDPAPTHLLLNRLHINHKPVPHITLNHPIIRLIHLLHTNNLHIRDDIVFGTMIQHFLRFFHPADVGAGEDPVSHDEGEAVYGDCFGWGTDEDEGAAGAEEVQIARQLGVREVGRWTEERAHAL
jgi:hypothetical protein